LKLGKRNLKNIYIYYFFLKVLGTKHRVIMWQTQYYFFFIIIINEWLITLYTLWRIFKTHNWMVFTKCVGSKVGRRSSMVGQRSSRARSSQRSNCPDLDQRMSRVVTG